MRAATRRWLTVVAAAGLACVTRAPADPTNQAVLVEARSREQVGLAVILNNGTNRFTGTFTGGIVATSTVSSSVGGYDDLRVSANAIKTAGTDLPTWSVWLGGIYGYTFSGTKTEEAWFTVQLPHITTNDTIWPHVHYNPGSDTGTNGVVWGLEYAFAEISNSFQTATMQMRTTNEQLTGTAYFHYMTKFPSITVTGVAPSVIGSAMLNCRLFRPHDDTHDDNTAAMFFQEFDFHYEITNPFGLEGDRP